jgi:glycosyltransferase involved in cell wall biosynthesis
VKPKPLIIDPSVRGGILRYTRLLAEALCLAGVSPTVLACRSAREARGPYVTRSWLPKQRWRRPKHKALWFAFYAGRSFAWLASAGLVELAIRVDHPDVVHFQSPITRHFDARLLRHVRRYVPVVWTAHDVLPPEPAPADAGRFASIYQTADLVVVHGEAAAEEVKRLAGIEAVIISHVPDDTVRIERREARRRLRLPDAERILGAIGFVRQYKGYDLLVDVWQRLGDSAPLLLVMGEAVDEDARQVLERLKESPRTIVRSGYASDEDLRLAMSAIDALVLPHISASESGLLQVARAVGLPVLASDAPQLATSVRALRAGVILRRNIQDWAKAVTGTLPPPPPAPPSGEVVGRAHIEAYQEAIRRARSRGLV